MGNVYAMRQIAAETLRHMAVAAHPHNRNHQARWLHAVRYLRRRRLCVRDGAETSWSVPGEGEAA